MKSTFVAVAFVLFSCLVLTIQASSFTRTHDELHGIAAHLNSLEARLRKQLQDGENLVAQAKRNLDSSAAEAKKAQDAFNAASRARDQAVKKHSAAQGAYNTAVKERNQIKSTVEAELRLIQQMRAIIGIQHHGRKVQYGKASNWVAYGSNGVYIDVDTRSAGFKTTPFYFTSLSGATRHWTITGITSVYNPTANGFRVYLRRDGGSLSVAQARQEKLVLNWVGVEASSSSNTLKLARGSGWRDYPSNGVFLDMKSGLTGQQTVVTSLQGSSHHWATTGATSVYSLNSNGNYRVYLHPHGYSARVAQAKQYRWALNSLAVSSNDPNFVSGSTNAWKVYNTNWLYIDVDTSKAGFTKTPIILTSISGTSHHWQLTGTNSLYQETPKGFRVYIRYSGGRTTPLSQSNTFRWTLNWVAVKASGN